jgi:hypothetical protein
LKPEEDMSALVHVVAVLITTLASTLAAFTGVTVTAQEPQVIRRTLQWPSGTRERRFELSNITGSVRIIGEDRSDVSVVATRTVTRQGKSDDPGPTPDFREATETVLVCGDSRRCGCHLESGPRDNWDEDRTRVRTEFEVHVPRAVTLDVCTVNGGTLHVQGTQGPFRIGNVNGDVEVSDIGGSGRVSTVNGQISASLTASPAESTRFQSVNGRVVVTLPSSLSADLRLKTMHGGLYTDFETTPLPARTSEGRRNGRFVYRSDRYVTVRVGSGGPELQFETVNGDVQVRKGK